MTLSPPHVEPRLGAAAASVDGQAFAAEAPTREKPGEGLLAQACLIGVLLVDLVLMRFGMDAQDEGYFLEQATRVLQGQVPYRDFDSLYTPGLLYLHAALLSLLGGSPLIDLRI
ncbi:MAG TPA: hypothetical protein VGK33_17770, partial [Chloroflexota bacterium]